MWRACVGGRGAPLLPRGRPKRRPSAINAVRKADRAPPPRACNYGARETRPTRETPAPVTVQRRAPSRDSGAGHSAEGDREREEVERDKGRKEREKEEEERRAVAGSRAEGCREERKWMEKRREVEVWI